MGGFCAVAKVDASKAARKSVRVAAAFIRFSSESRLCDVGSQGGQPVGLSRRKAKPLTKQSQHLSAIAEASHFELQGQNESGPTAEKQKADFGRLFFLINVACGQAAWLTDAAVRRCPRPIFGANCRHLDYVIMTIAF